MCSAGATSAPVFTSSLLGTVSLFHGQSTVLDCTASGSPSPSISWTMNGQSINFSSLSTVQLASNGSLIFSEVTGTEEGNYSCTAVNQEGSYSIHFLLSILGGQLGTVGELSAMKRKSQMTVLSGASLTLDCGLLLYLNKVDFWWRHKGKLLCDNERLRMDRNGSLLLSPVTLEHAGVYECQALLNMHVLKTAYTLDIFPRRGIIFSLILFNLCSLSTHPIIFFLLLLLPLHLNFSFHHYLTLALSSFYSTSLLISQLNQNLPSLW